MSAAPPDLPAGKAHAAKTRALLAYDVGMLSEAGRARVERHLASCDVCQHQLAAMRSYGELSAHIREAEIPALDYSRMELSLRREAHDQAASAPGKSGRAATWAMLALAAAVSLGLFGWRQRPQSPQASRLPEAVAEGARARMQHAAPEPAVPVEATVEGELTAVAGSARLGETQAELGDVLHEGDVLETDASSALHGRLAAGTGFVLSPDSRLELSRVRPSGVVLSLARGAVSSAVHTGDVYRVEAGAYRVVVRGTRFSVARRGEGVHVSLAEGSVAIERGDETLEVLRGPAEWSSEDAPVAAPVDAPVALDMDAPWPSVTLPPFPRVVAWELEGARFAAQGQLALRAPIGELSLRALDARGRSREITLDVLPEGLILDETMLPRVPNAPARGELSADAIRTVVRAGQLGLRRCYDRVLRRLGDPSLTRAAYSLRVDVGMRGDVRRVRLTASGGEAHQALRDCITHEVRSWTFPAPRGGPVSFDLPLNLSAR